MKKPPAGDQPKRRTVEQRRQSARRQTRSYRAAAALAPRVERRARRQPKRQAIEPRQPLAAGSIRSRALAGVAALTLAGLLAFGFFDSRFYVQAADISGVQYSPLEQVNHQAALDGYNIFWVNARAAAQRIEALPYVKQADVLVALPNRVQIEVTERTPVAVWRVGGQDLWVDVEGVTMPVASPSLAMPLLTDFDGSSVLPEGGIDPQLISSIDELKQRLPEVTAFAYDRFNGLQFRLPGGANVLLGKPEGLAQRVEELLVLQASLASFGQQPLEIDWRFEDGYTLKLP
jgi:cell division septal protein FtsQ